MTNIDFSNPNGHDPVEYKQWLAKLEKDLKDKPVEKLYAQIEPGLKVAPLFPQDQQASLSDMGYPGNFPFVRSACPEGHRENGWQVCQKYDQPTSALASEAIVQDLQKGVHALWVCLKDNEGIRIQDVEDLEQVFNGVDLEQTPVLLDVDSVSFSKEALFFGAAKKMGVNLSLLKGSVGFDPFEALVSRGKLVGGLKGAIAEMAELTQFSMEHVPHLRTVVVSNVAYEHAGATWTEQLAWSMASGLYYLRGLEAQGLKIEEIAKKVLFRFSVGSDFFTEISKLRAARLLWSKVLCALGVQHVPATIHAVTSQKNKTKKDPWVNMLRITSEGFSAAVGGADFITTLGFDDAVGLSDDFARRVSRNTQTILREESHLHRVIDPAGGSGYMDWLTDQLARKAWEKFQAIEEAGGMKAFIASGALHESLRRAKENAKEKNSTRKAPIVGVSIFANLEEESLVRQKRAVQNKIKNQIGSYSKSLGSEKQYALAKQLMNITQIKSRSSSTLGEPGHIERRLGEIQRKFDKVMGAWDRPTEGPTQSPKEAPTQAYCIGQLFSEMVDVGMQGMDVSLMNAIVSAGLVHQYVQPIQAVRDAEAWESLREASDSYLQKHGNRPKVFLANIGNLKDYKARAGFAEQLLSAGGLKVVSVGGFEQAEKAVKAFKGAKTIVTVLCGTDEHYVEHAEQFSVQLKQAGAQKILLAGHPKKFESQDFEASLRKSGVDDFIYQGVDALGVLQSLHEAMGLYEFSEARQFGVGQ